MNYTEYGEEDFLADESFQRYCLGTNEKDVNFWQAWMAANPQKYDTIKKAKELYLLLNGNNTAADYNKDARFFREALEAHVERTSGVVPSIPKRSSRTRVLLMTSAVAASVLLVIMITRRTEAATAD